MLVLFPIVLIAILLPLIIIGISFALWPLVKVLAGEDKADKMVSTVMEFFLS